MRIMSLSGTLKQALVTLLFCLVTIGLTSTAWSEEPPYTEPTSYYFPNVISFSDPSTFVTLETLPDAMRIMGDARSGEDAFPLKPDPRDPNPVHVYEIIRTPYLFRATFNDGSKIEVQVNREIGTRRRAFESAERYLKIIGQLPTILRNGVKKVWLHKEGPREMPFFALGQGIYLSDIEAAKYLDDGTLEEVLFHEATHTSLSFLHNESPDWQAAQNAAGKFLSDYGRDNRVREDFCESFVAYYAIQYRPSRIPKADLQTILATIPNRIAYFDLWVPDLEHIRPQWRCTTCENTLPTHQWHCPTCEHALPMQEWHCPTCELGR